MIPTLAVILAVYPVVRLVTVALHQFPNVEKHLAARVTVAVLAIIAAGVITYMAVSIVVESTGFSQLNP